MDILFIVALTVIYSKFISHPKGIGDGIGWFMGNLMLYTIFKIPGIVAFQGFKNYFIEAAEANPTHHFVSGLVSFSIVCSFYYWIFKKNRQQSEAV